MSSTSTSNSSQFLTLQTSLAVLEYVLFYVPTLILGGLYVVALVRTKSIHLKMKVTLTKNFIPDLVKIVSATFALAMLPLRVYTSSAAFKKVTCVMFFNTYIIGQVGDMLASTFFVISVHFFVKLGIKKLKWHPIICFITVSWVAIAIGAIIHSAISGKITISINGTCALSRGVSADADLVNIIILLGMALVLVVCACTVIAFATASYCYVKRTTVRQDSESPNPIKSALPKVLMFETVKMVFLLIHIMITYASFFFNPFNGTIITHLVVFSNGILTLITPIITVALLKPIRDPLKQMFKPLHCCSCKGVPAAGNGEGSNAAHL